MFTVDPNITDLKVREKNLFQVFFSMNSHQVANPDMSLEEARSYVFFFREGRDNASAYIGLHFLHSDSKLYYKYSGNPFPESRLADVEDESRRFAEDLGAMLDDLDFSKMSVKEKDQWIDEQEMLSGRKKEPPLADGTLENETAPVKAADPDQSIPAPIQDQQPVVAPQVEPPVTVQPVQQAQQPVQPAIPVQQTVQPAQPVAAPPAPATGTVRSTQVRQTGGLTSANTKKKPAEPIEQIEQIKNEAPPEERSSAESVQPVDVLEEALKAGVVKAPKDKLKKDIRIASGLVSRDREALARLLASF